MKVFGHGGMGYHSHFPMDSFESLQAALETGADGTEMDLRLTADSVLVLFHDEDLHPSTTGKGKITEQTADAIKNFSFKDWGKRYPIVTAQEFLSRVKIKPEQWLTLECKVPPNEDPIRRDRFARAFVQLIKSLEITNKILVEAQDEFYLEEIAKALPSVETYYYGPSYAVNEEVCKKFHFTGMVIQLEKISADQIKAAHSYGLKVSVFNATHERQNVEALEMSPDQIQTDALKHLVKVTENL